MAQRASQPIAGAMMARSDCCTASSSVCAGLAPPTLERLFDAFYTTKAGGMGMGLSICRSIIEAYGGRLRATANEPRAALFQFTLPPERDETVVMRRRARDAFDAIVPGLS
jgi:K+-sensing histidine kinase KdpD